MGKKFMGYDNASELLTAIGNKIKANKSNTLYAINTGVKNALVVEDRESSGSGTIKFSAKNGVVTVTGTAGSNTSFFSFNFTGISGRFKLNGCPSGGSDNTYLHRIYTADGSIAIAIDRGSGTAEFTLDPNVTYQWTLRIQANYAIQDSLVFRPMLYQADTDGSIFQSGAPPNYDLTRLETEDRAARAEVVDSGAKNLYLYNESYGFDNCSVDSEGVYTTAGDSLPNLRLQLSLYGDSGVIENLNVNPQGEFPTITATGVYHCIFTHLSGATNLMIGHKGSTYNGRYRQPISNLTPGTTYVISLNLTQVTNASGQFKWEDVMICTLADWKVSQKYVPHCKSNYDLTQDKLNRCRKVLLSGSLDNIKDNEIHYVSSDVTGIPTSERAWGFVRTTMHGDSTGIQEFFSVTEPRESYVRVLRQNTWQSWIKTGGVTNWRSDVTFTTANTYQKITSVTIPAGVYARISAGEFYSNSIPTGVIISKAADVASITAGNTFAKAEQSNTAADYKLGNLSASTYFFNTGTAATWSVFCKCANSNAKNTVFVTLEILK